MKYFLIHSDDEGEISIEQLDKETLLERLNKSYYGDNNFLSEITETDPVYWKNGNILIIEGDIVVPMPKAIVREYVV